MLGFNRWHLFKILTAILFIAGIGWLALDYFIPAPPSKITIATGFKGGAYEFFGAKYQEILARSRVKVEVRLTEGTGQNLELLQDPKSGVQVAFVQGGVSDNRRSPGLLSLGRINYQLFAVFYRATETFDDLTQIKGKRIAVGPVGSGTQVTAAKILGISGITSETATLVPLAGQAAVNALHEGKVDVLFVANVPDAPLVQELIKDPRYRLMNFSRAKAITRILPFLVRLELAQGVIDFEKNIPAADVTLLGTTNAVLVRNDLHPEIINLLTQTLLEAHNDAGIFQQFGEFPSQTDPEFPIAPSARDFYKNGPSFLNRYLPFWLTNYVERAIAVLVTVVAITIPLFNFAPKLYMWFVRQFMAKAYRRMRIIEKELQAELTAPQVAVLQADLESIDRATRILPMRHSDLFFAMRLHIDLMRTQLASRLIEARSQTAKVA